MLEDALSNVRVLGEIAVGDSVPAIEAYSTSLLYRADFDTNFQDRNSFIMGNAKFNEEAVVQANLNTLLEEGEQYAVMMYTWRCCSRAQPIPATDQFDKIDVYQKIIDVYEPEITKLKNFYYFVNKATERFITEIKRMCRKDFVSEVYLWTLGRFINMFAVLDALKNAKASIKNDHAAYRRANQILKKMNDSQMIHESQNLTLFLADNDKISKSLQTKLEHINGAEDLLADVVSACCNMYENKHFVLPKEKEILLKVMVFGLYLLDGMNIPVYKLEEKKKLNLVKIDKFIKGVQVVPIFGDMQIELPTYIKKLKCFQENTSRWTCTQGGNVCAQSSILDKIASMRVQHHALMVELSKIKNESPLTDYFAAEKADLRNRDIYLAALHCLRCVAAWNSVVSEVLSWKLVNPVRDKPKIHEDMDTDYALVTKYNYSPEECTAIVEAISMIKSMQKLMLEMESMLTEAVKSHTYYELQNFVQLTLREPIRQAVKKKRPNLQQHLQAIRDCCADWNDKRPPVDDPALKGEKDPKSGYTIILPRKSVGPSSTQLYMVRTMIESSLSERGAGGTKKKDSLRKELEGSCVQAIEQFHLHSYFWSYMLNFNQSLFDACDLSQLWFREFYLEMAMGKHIQFPIDMSMPWILANHIINSEDCSAMLEHVLVPFDLYNDSGTYALTKFKKQFLYDEIEAELNLCFDQLIVTLSEKIYGHYKVMASSLLLDKKFRAEKSKLGQDLPFPAAIRYDTILRQRHVQLLGRSVDLSRVIAQRIISLLQQSLIVAIRKFTSRDLHGLVELDMLLEVNKLCHKLLSEQILLPNFEDLVKEANNNIVAPYGIITLHVFHEVNNCLLPGYCFNFSTQRFTKQVVSAAGVRIGDQATKHRDNPLSHVELFHLYGSTSLNRAFNQICDLYSTFIGSEHLKIMCNMLGYQGIAVLIEEIVKEITSKLTPTDNATSNHLVNQAIRLSKVRFSTYSLLITLPRGSVPKNSVINSVLKIKTAQQRQFTERGNLKNMIVVCFLFNGESRVLIQNQSNDSP